MQVLFIHQNMPGQFRHLAAALAADPANVVRFLTRRANRSLPGVERLVYETARAPHVQTHRYLRQFEDGVLHGQAVARACLALRQQGFRPDIVIGHPGWGETLFVKDIYPDVPLLNYGEFFYRSHGADMNFDPSEPSDIDAVCGLRARNAQLLVALEAADRTLCPTHWQKALHPTAFHDRISVVFDGVDTEIVRPEPTAGFRLPDGRLLTRDDEVVTYVARNLEPLRGFRQLMRALPRICALRPRAQIVILGNDQRGYGAAAPDGTTWKQAIAAEIPVDPARVHFCGVVDYANYLDLLRISSVHVYLSYPFVLSWSLVEAMAAGCLVIGSRTPPVEEMIDDGDNGILVDFFSPDALAETVAAALAEPRGFERLRRRAREHVVDGYSTAACVPRQRAIVDELTGGLAGGGGCIGALSGLNWQTLRKPSAAPAACAWEARV